MQISLVDVTKSFGGRLVVSGIDLEVATGEIVTLLGPSGCGKTTLLRLIAGLEALCGGEIRLDGEPPAAARARKEIGWVPQSPALLPWRTVEANARLLTDVNRRANRNLRDPVDHIELLREVGLGDYLDARPHELSGGMQQRVALVRAFALGARLLLLDEPFAALDEITRTEMRHLLAALCERIPTTVVFVTHSVAEAVFLSDRVLVITPRPGTIAGHHVVDLARPRLPELEDDPRFFGHLTRLRSVLGNAHRGATAS
jgi:NitT/TauT family transport system ATP-binding protein